LIKIIVSFFFKAHHQLPQKYLFANAVNSRTRLIAPTGDVIKTCAPGATVPLNYPCGPDDVCADVNAFCVGGICRCQPTFYEESNVCRESPHTTVSINQSN